MFTIFNAEKSRIINFITKQLSNNDLELEAILFKNIVIDYNIYNNILKKLIFSEKNNGYGLEYKIYDILDVRTDNNKYNNLRESVYKKSNIMLYTLNYKNAELIIKKNPNDIGLMIKDRKDSINLKNYPIKISLSEEKELKNRKINLLLDTKISKIYRYKKRISIFTKDNLFKFDFTSIKIGRGQIFALSNTLQNSITYEIEIEYIGKNIKDKNLIFDKLMMNIALLMSIKNNSSIFLSIDMNKEILDKYKLLISTDEKLRKKNRNKTKNNNLTYKHFITAKPVTLHLENVKPGKNINILTNYGVTYKADGKNALLYIYPSDKSNNFINNVFIIDSMFRITPININIPLWGNSIIEGEYIEDKMLFCAYDMLFTKNIDIRNKPLVSFIENKTSRLSYLQNFIKDISDIKSDIKIIEKKYKFGNDNKIFEEVKKLWDNRKLKEYHIDGLIFTPLIESYPIKIKSWNKLFKWKPSYLNSIDVLIEFVKGENKKDLIFPYTGTSDIKNYKKLRLYTTGFEDKLNRKSGNIIRKSYPKLFKEINVPVDSEKNIYSIDPLSGNKSRVIDDTIVEFVF